MKYHIIYACGDTQANYECGGMSDCSRCEYERPLRVADVALCAGRHDIPLAIDGAVFDHDVDPTDPLKLELEATRLIRENQIEAMTLYVTGLTVALVAVMNVCRRLNIRLILMHYDRERDKYIPQFVR